MVCDFPACPSNSGGTLTNYSRDDIGLVMGRYKQPDAQIKGKCVALILYLSHASKGLLDNPMGIVPVVKRTKKKSSQPPVEAVSQVLVHPDPRVRLLVRLFTDAGIRRMEQ